MAPNAVLGVLGGGDLVGNDGALVPVSSLEGKNIALYFSAHWCPPCRAFTPQLAKTYEALRTAGRQDFEFIFVSSDRSEAQFNEYSATMPWVSLPYSRRAEKAALSRHFGVSGIPALVTVAPDGTTINRGARSAASDDRMGLQFPWPPQPLANLEATTECGGHHINNVPALVVFLEACDDAEQSEVLEGALRPAAEAEAAAAKASGAAPKLIWFYAAGGGGPVAQVRRLCGLGPDASGDGGPVMVILDIRDKGAFYRSNAPQVTPQAVAAFADAFKDGRRGLTRQQLS